MYTLSPVEFLVLNSSTAASHAREGATKMPFPKTCKENPQHPTLSVVQVAHEFYMEISFSASQTWSESVQCKKLPFYGQNNFLQQSTGEELAKKEQSARLYFARRGAGASQVAGMKTGESCGCWVNVSTCYSEEKLGFSFYWRKFPEKFLERIDIRWRKMFSLVFGWKFCTLSHECFPFIILLSHNLLFVLLFMEIMLMCNWCHFVSCDLNFVLLCSFLKKYIDPRNIHHAVKDAKQILQVTDLDKDGKMSLHEAIICGSYLIRSKFYDVVYRLHNPE